MKKCVDIKEENLKKLRETYSRIYPADRVTDTALINASISFMQKCLKDGIAKDIFK